MNKEEKKIKTDELNNRNIGFAEDDKNKRYFRLRKRKAAVRRERIDREEKSREIFERKMKNAPGKKAPVTSRTRGYYRFSRDFPSNVDENRFRENLKYGEKRRTRHAIIASVCCILAFCVGFIPARTAMFISSYPVQKQQKPQNDGETHSFSMKGIFITYDELKSGDAAAIIEKLKKNNCDTAVFEFKNDSGYCIFNTGSFIGSSADRRIPTAFDTANSVKAAGFSTAAYISCFLDSCAAVADYTFAVRSNSAEGGAWRDNSSRCWLNPFSADAKKYLLSVIEAAANGGFSRIILGNVRFPTDSGESEAFFAGESSSGIGRNGVLRAFVSSAVSAAGKASVTLLCGLDAVNSSPDNKLGGTSGSLLGSAAGSVCIDARASEASDKMTVGEKTVIGAPSMPYVLVSEIARYTLSNIKNTENESPENVFLIIDGGESFEDEKAALELSGADGFIIKN